MKILDGKDYIPQVRRLITEYVRQLNRDLAFQNIDEELQNPSQKYTAPQGELLVALEGDAVIGMVAYHKHSEQRCEMKRLYVQPAARGLRLCGKFWHAQNRRGFGKWCRIRCCRCRRQSICIRNMGLWNVRHIIITPWTM